MDDRHGEQGPSSGSEQSDEKQQQHNETIPVQDKRLKLEITDEGRKQSEEESSEDELDEQEEVELAELMVAMKDLDKLKDDMDKINKQLDQISSDPTTNKDDEV